MDLIDDVRHPDRRLAPGLARIKGVPSGLGGNIAVWLSTGVTIVPTNMGVQLSGGIAEQPTSVLRLQGLPSFQRDWQPVSQ